MITFINQLIADILENSFIKWESPRKCVKAKERTGKHIFYYAKYCRHLTSKPILANLKTK